MYRPFDFDDRMSGRRADYPDLVTVQSVRLVGKPKMNEDPIVAETSGCTATLAIDRDKTLHSCRCFSALRCFPAHGQDREFRDVNDGWDLFRPGFPAFPDCAEKPLLDSGPPGTYGLQAGPFHRYGEEICLTSSPNGWQGTMPKLTARSS